MTGLRLLGGTVIAVEEDYDTAVEKFWPSQGAPSSALQARENNTWTAAGTKGRLLINPANITVLIEDYDPDEDDEHGDEH